MKTADTELGKRRQVALNMSASNTARLLRRMGLETMTAIRLYKIEHQIATPTDAEKRALAALYACRTWEIR